MGKRLLGAGFALVSIDYRLAPESKLPEILSDVEDALRWIRSEGRELLQVDPSRVLVMGGSAGGYLALMSGLLDDDARPAALVVLFGYGEIDGLWLTEPSEFHRTSGSVSESVAFAAVRNRPLSNSEGFDDSRRAFYLYCRQEGLWIQQVTGVEPGDPALDPWCPVRNVDSTYPPTLLLHGDRDRDVPYQQALDLVREFRAHGVEHQLFTVENGDHGFDGGEAARIEDAWQTIAEFALRRASE